mmetsp:Transcript_50346/g.118241  ORF Transcript_50346/g.118241 Transcript_50346/m.118241 type:complete len:257 (+) Transcript_50346:184-954(+)
MRSQVLFLGGGRRGSGSKGVVARVVGSVFDPWGLVFVVCTGLSLAALTYWSFLSYGDDFLEHSYLYHLSRQDHRHNFSFFFYLLYLGQHSGAPSTVLSLAPFAPQLVLAVAAAVRYSGDIVFACFVQTLVFVAYNKVVTVQYFVWFLTLFPMAVACSTMSRTHMLTVAAVWAGALGAWLHVAYRLEFLGEDTFMQLWGTSLAFFAANIIVTFSFLSKYDRHGRAHLKPATPYASPLSYTAATSALSRRPVGCDSPL